MRTRGALPALQPDVELAIKLSRLFCTLHNSHRMCVDASVCVTVNQLCRVLTKVPNFASPAAPQFGCNCDPW